MTAHALVTVRPETTSDLEAVRRVNVAAFGQPDEADLVDRLRERAADYLAFVAVVEGEVVGHIAFTPVTLDVARPDLSLVGLAPMAVAPERQRTGVGSALVEAGLDACREAGFDAVFVLGHPAYYPRFGFAPTMGIVDTYGAPPEAFMVKAFNQGSLDGVEGTAHYDPAFAD